MDLTTLSDDELEEHRVAVLTEKERRQRCAELPEQITDMCRAAVAAGVPEAAVLDAAEQGSTPTEFHTDQEAQQ